MIDKIRLAARNVRRNGRRSFICLVMISGGIAAITVFEGLSHYLLKRMREVVINNQFSHVQIATDKAWSNSSTAKASERLLTLDEQTLSRINGAGEVEYTSGRLSFFGIINSGEQSLSARGVGFDPSVESHLRESLRVIDGNPLSLGAPESCEILLGVLLADQAGIKAGQMVTMMGYTVDGAMNAFDCEVKGIFRNGFEGTDNVFYVPLKTAQNFLGTDRIDRLIVQLKDTEKTDHMLSWLKSVLPSATMPKGWLQLSAFFRQTVEYVALQTSIVRWIILALALLATLNTISLSISERAGEIGTVRALGDSRSAILGQFLLEGIVLGVIGAIVGSLLGASLAALLSSLEIPFVIPGASVALPMKVDILPRSYRDAVFAMCAITLVATLWPAFRASRLEIVEALKRNI